MRLKQAVHNALACRDAVDVWLVDGEEDPEYPRGEVNPDLHGEENPGTGPGKEEEVASSGMVEEETQGVMEL